MTWLHDDSRDRQREHDIAAYGESPYLPLDEPSLTECRPRDAAVYLSGMVDATIWQLEGLASVADAYCSELAADIRGLKVRLEAALLKIGEAPEMPVTGALCGE